MILYEKEFKEEMVKKMIPPNTVSVAQLSRQTGVSEAALCDWRNNTCIPALIVTREGYVVHTYLPPLENIYRFIKFLNHS